MNIYGLRAKEHWEKYAPSRVAEMEDPQEFFETLGESAEQQIVALSHTMEERDRLERRGLEPRGYLEQVGHLNVIRASAQEVVLADLIYSVTPEPEDALEELSDLEGKLPNAAMLEDSIESVRAMVAEQAEDEGWDSPIYSPEEKAEIDLYRRLIAILVEPWSENDLEQVERRIEALKPFLEPSTQAIKTYL